MSDAFAFPPPTEDVHQGAAQTIETWLDDLRASSAAENIEAMPSESRWFVRLHSDERGTYTVWMHLHQRLCHFEVYVLPRPERQRERVFEYLLRQNATSWRARCAVADEEAIYVRSAIAIDRLTHAELDSAFGEVIDMVERIVGPIVRMAFAKNVDPETSTG